MATPLTEGALQADASGYVLHRNVSQLSHIFGGTASHATEVRATRRTCLPTPALPDPVPDPSPHPPTEPGAGAVPASHRLEPQHALPERPQATIHACA